MGRERRGEGQLLTPVLDPPGHPNHGRLGALY